MAKTIGLAMLVLGVARYALAGTVSPEIDASSGVAALALLSGGLLILRSRRRRG